MFFGIFFSVIVAFSIGALIQFISRIILSFKFEEKAKKMLSAEIVTRFHGEEKALLAEKEFTNRFSKGNDPAEIKLIKLSMKTSSISILDLLSSEELGDYKLCKSKSEARRMIAQGAVKIDGKKISDDDILVQNPSENTYQVGKLKHLKIKLKKG